MTLKDVYKLFADLEGLFVVLWNESWCGRVVGHRNPVLRETRQSGSSRGLMGSMPSSTGLTDIPLDALPFLNPRNAHDEGNFPDSPTITRHLHPNRELDDEDASRRSTTITPAWRLHLYNLLERPNSSPAAVLVHVLVTVMITFSALVTILETVPAFHSLPGGIWFGLETSLVALFTVEYVARCAATSYSWSSFFAWVGCAFLCLLCF